MKTEAIDFCKKYKESLINKEILKNEKSLLIDKYDKNFINFYIFSKEKSRYDSNTCLLKLDEEYLYKKYSKKVQEELEQNIQELKEKYKL